MPSPRIESNRIQILIRQAVDMAVHSSVRHFSDDLGDKEQLAYQIARAAAEAAVETLTTQFNHELRLIQIYHAQRMEAEWRKPSRAMYFGVVPAQQKD